MHSVAAQYERSAPLRAVASEETRLRNAALEPPANTADYILQWARVLELSLVFASLHDAILQLGLATVADLEREFERVDAIVGTLSCLDVKTVFAENLELLRPFARVQPRPDDPATIDTATVVRNTRSLLLNCPLVDIERAAHTPGVAQAAHRCRLAFDALKAFVARHESPDHLAVAVAGQVYAEGRASIEEVAAMLGRDVPDVVALLEERGYRRSIEGIRLAEVERAAKLRQIREDRVARDGEPRSTESDIARDVVASQRIEGIDARPWLRS